ncbi:cytochrome c biogenesis protein [Halioglobus japonicus]|uniref:Disulfide bond formation protein DsbD n=2 Tax=Halioglobus japonicus TaxID=930805 RepID=A0AAP8SM12_9GAMM|nr:protein-disulfide reductase DsbD [Halioglobus japonicus]PLW84916.1 disulfide bond formation protein DsbD [Halioglobus japonicus]GHD18500.1 cytochrome c biogenesis protein [Halioglobus japonicus]
MRLLLATLLLLTSTFSQAQLPGTNNPFAAEQPDFLPVEEAYQLEVEPSDEGLRFYWQIADGYYLYQHAFKFQGEDDEGALALQGQLPQGIDRTDEFFGDVTVYYNQADVTVEAERQGDDTVQLTVTSQGCADAGLCYPPRKQFFSWAPDAGTVTETTPPARKASVVTTQKSAPQSDGASPAQGLGSLPYMMLLAFLGGAILNLMPCVFPILSLKVLSFAQSTDEDRHLHSWLYTAGVVISFVAIAAVLIGLQQAGSAVGWGFQLQSPGFVIALAYLFLVMGLSLSGLVSLGGNLMNTGSSLADRGGLSGSFFTGVLAVVVASPCTAPFMGTALGFAVTQPPVVGLSVFAALGVGMAAPLLLFSYSGGARALMPRPGPWMETLKEFLAFPLYGAAIWLVWVAGRQTGVNTMAAVLCGALLLTLGLWLWQQGGKRRWMAAAAVISAIALASIDNLDPVRGGQASLGEGRVAWSEPTLEELRAAGKPVFVDVTADWCITCLANERAVLFTDDITAAFADHGVTYMVADWTNYDAEIAEFIASHGRTGIPLYVMYPPLGAGEPFLLPQILTDQLVIDALNAVSGK